MPKLLREVERYARMKYPKVGQPFETIGMTSKTNTLARWMPHIIDSESEGHFVNYWVDTEERTWEISIHICAEIKKNKKEKGKI